MPHLTKWLPRKTAPHIEVLAEVPAQCVQFYTSLFGWEFTKWEGPADYWLISTGPAAEPGIHGGLLRRHGPAPVSGQPVNSFVCTISVENLDATVERGQSLGATVAVPKMAVPGGGWLAYLTDGEGNIFGVLQNDPAAH
jgi:predicted enzyme related to lactoylglutathione lyase